MMRRLLFVLLMSIQTLVLASVVVQVDPMAIYIGETVELTLTLDHHERSVPDLAPLRNDFTVVGSQHQISYTSMNGRSHMLNQWRILLQPKKVGRLLIPPIQIGKERSASTKVDVESRPGGIDHQQLEEGKDILLKNSALPKQPYINQEVIYTVKLYNSQQLLDVEYHPPDLEDAIVVALGEGVHYQSRENNRVYAVDEQRYAVFPQKNGKIRIRPPQFRALIYDFVPRRVNVQGKPVDLTVKEVPAEFQGEPWLPAKQVELTERYSQVMRTAEEGQTVVRHVTLKARGFPVQLLPALTFESNDSVSVYPDKPETKNDVENGELVGTATYKVTYLFSKAGEAVIPDIKLPWFNTTTEKRVVASLTKRVIRVSPKAGTHGAVTPQEPSHPTVNKPLNTEARVVETNHSPNWKPALWHLFVGVITILAFFFFAGLAYYRKTSHRLQKKRALKRVKRACQQNSPALARRALLQWASLQWSDGDDLNLDGLKRHVDDPGFKQEIDRLSEALYGAEAKDWRGDALWRSITKRKSRKISKQKNSLPPINPK